MPQCKAQTLSGTQCVTNAAPPSKSLCGRHQKIVAAGTAVINFESGRKFPMPASNAKVAVAVKPSRAQAARRPAAQVAAGSVNVESSGAREPRMAGEHPLTCDGPQCSSRPLAGSNYCMSHQALA